MAVVGCGVRGTDNALSIMEARLTSLEMVMDADEDQARRLGERVNTRWTTDLKAILDDERVDAVFISTPHYQHAAQAIAALSAGKHVVVEKPLADSLAAAAEMIRAAVEAGKELSGWFGSRYLPEVVKAKMLIDEGALGELLGGHLVHHLWKPIHYFYRKGSPNWRARREAAGGGVLITQAIHYLDWLLYLAKVPVSEVSATYGTLDGDMDVEDTMAMWLRFENGAVATCNVASCVQGLYRFDQAITEFRLWGTDGHLSLTPPPQFFSSRVVDGKRPERWHDLAPLPHLKSPSIEFLERFAGAVLRGERPEITAEEGLHVQAVIEAAYTSGRVGRPVAVETPEL
jgi:UDP-N-acetyl-2-amino-2-deoxyglucuronate dehydrogenase